MEHILKTAPAYYDAIARGEKNFEVRRDDRGYQKGDMLILQRCRDDRPHEVEWDMAQEHKLGERQRARHELTAIVRWILTGGQYGIEPGYVVMALDDVKGNSRH